MSTHNGGRPWLPEPSPLRCDAPYSDPPLGEWMTGTAEPRGVRGVATVMGNCDDVFEDSFDLNDCSGQQ
jgi:hypothetical protein